LATNIFEKTEAQIKGLSGAYDELLDGVVGEKAVDATKLVAKLKSLNTMALSINSSASHLAKAEGNVLTSDELLGGKVVYLSIPTSDASIGKAVQQFGAGVGNLKEKMDVDEKGDVAVLTTSQVSDLGKKIKLIGDRMSNFKRKFEERDKAKSKMLKSLEKFEKDVDKASKDMSTENKQAAKDTIRAAKLVMEAMDNPVSDYARYLVTTLGTVIGWGEKSLSMYKES